MNMVGKAAAPGLGTAAFLYGEGKLLSPRSMPGKCKIIVGYAQKQRAFFYIRSVLFVPLMMNCELFSMERCSTIYLEYPVAWGVLYLCAEFLEDTNYKEDNP